METGEVSTYLTLPVDVYIKDIDFYNGDLYLSGNYRDELEGHIFTYIKEPEIEIYARIVDLTYPETVEVGAQLSVDVIVGYSLPESTSVKTCIYDPTSEQYLDEINVELHGVGQEVIRFDLIAPMYLGDFPLQADISYMEEGVYVMSDTGAVETFTISFESGSYAYIESIEYPDTVEPEEYFEAQITYSYYFNTPTNVTLKLINDMEMQDSTWSIREEEHTETVTLTGKAPSEEGIIDFTVDISWLSDGSWVYNDEDSEYIFSVSVVAAEDVLIDVEEDGGGIPGYPVSAVLAGLIIFMILSLQQNKPTI
jgi:hypothetical protein